MTEYEKLVQAEKYAYTIEIIETATEKTGVANTKDGNVRLFYGADDGSDDKTVTDEVFHRYLQVSDIITG